MSEAADTETTRALVLTRLVIEALDARDLDALAVLVAEDAEFRNPSGGSSHGREAVERIVEAANKARVWLFRRGTETSSRANGTMRIDTPVVELVGGSEIDGTANFEVRDSELTAFASPRSRASAAPLLASRWAFSYWVSSISSAVRMSTRDAWSEQQQPAATQENAFIEGHGIEAYGRWHLAVDDELNPTTCGGKGGPRVDAHRR